MNLAVCPEEGLYKCARATFALRSRNMDNVQVVDHIVLILVRIWWERKRQHKPYSQVAEAIPSCLAEAVSLGLQIYRWAG